MSYGYSHYRRRRRYTRTFVENFLELISPAVVLALGWGLIGPTLVTSESIAVVYAGALVLWATPVLVLLSVFLATIPAAKNIWDMLAVHFDR